MRRHHRHAALNNVVHRALAAAKIPSRLEPSGLYRTDGKRPDGITVVPWKSGRLLVWDATCPDTFAPSYVASATNEAGAVAALAEERKKTKYAHLDSSHTFTPVAIETSGVIGPQSMIFVRDLGRRLAQVTGEERSSLPLTSSRTSLWQSNEGMQPQYEEPLDSHPLTPLTYGKIRIYLIIIFFCIIYLLYCVLYIELHILIIRGNRVYRQCVGIPMGTDCAPLLANLFLFYYEYKYMKNISQEVQ